MWSRLRASFTSASSICRWGRSERGAAALLYTLGTLTVLLLLGAGLVSIIKQELRMSRIEAEAEQGLMLVMSGFNEAMKLADQSDWPDHSPQQGTICSPAPMPPYPSYCIIPQPRESNSNWMGDEVIPVQVKWQISAQGEIEEAKGWIVLAMGEVNGVVAYRSWCDPPRGDEATKATLRLCAYGG